MPASLSLVLSPDELFFFLFASPPFFGVALTERAFVGYIIKREH
jgi:hypothetical protein